MKYTMNLKWISNESSFYFKKILLAFTSFQTQDGVPAVGGFKFSMAQKKLQKVQVGGSAS